MNFVAASYADFKLVAAQFTSGKVFYVPSSGSNPFKCWGMASGFPVLIGSATTTPGTFATDFPTAVQLAGYLATDIG